ncbi:MAG: hypothetical protein IPJ01_11275 [Micavibrio sp.]|nr:hypothetical protein [Micavibrio sp.]
MTPREEAISICADNRGRIEEFLHENNIEATNESIKNLSVKLGLQQVEKTMLVLERMNDSLRSITTAETQTPQYKLIYFKEVKEEIELL